MFRSMGSAISTRPGEIQWEWASDQATKAEPAPSAPPPAPAAPGTTAPEASSPSRAELIDGTKLASEVLGTVKRGVDAIAAAAAAEGAAAAPPRLVVVLVGANSASLSYIKRKTKAAADCGIDATTRELPAETSQAEVLALVGELNGDDAVHGVIVQLPLPAHLHAPEVTNAIAPHKDVDGFTPPNIGGVALEGHEPLFCPCTPKGCLQLIKSVRTMADRGATPLRGLEACVIGASNIVGMPMALLLMREGCTVTVCHIDTVDPASDTCCFSHA